MHRPSFTISTLVVAGSILLIVLAMTSFAVKPAYGASVGDKSTGRSIALRVCSACHKVTAIQAQPKSNLGAPGFIQYARRASTTEFRIRRFFQTPHERMPNFQFSPAETDDLVAYILSLK